MAINLERFVKAKRFTEDHVLDDASDQILIKVATDTVAGKVALNAGTSLPGDATNCTDALTACGLNALLNDPAAGGNAVINNVKALVPLATTTVAGLIEEATGEETRLGATDPNKADRAVTPESMSYALQTGKDYPIDVESSITEPYANYQSINGTITGVNTGTAGNGFNVGVEGRTLAVSTGASYGVRGDLVNGTANTTSNLTNILAAATIGRVDATVTTNSVSTGVYGLNFSAGSGTKVGLAGSSQGTGGGTNIGVYGTAGNGTTNWAGYFDGFTVVNAGTTLAAGLSVGAGLTNRANYFLGRTNADSNTAEPTIQAVNRNANGVGLSGSTTDTGPNSSGVSGVKSSPNGILSGGLAGAFGSVYAAVIGWSQSGLDQAGYFVGTVITTGSMTASSYVTSSDATLKENVQAIDPVKALAFRNGLQWKRYELFSEQQEQIMDEVTEEVAAVDSEGNPVMDSEGNPVMETVTKQVPTGRYEVKRSSQGIKRGLIAQEVLALAQSIGDFTDVVVEVGEYFTLDAQGYPVKDAQGNNIVNKRLGIDYDAVSFCVMCAEQVAIPLAV